MPRPPLHPTLASYCPDLALVEFDQATQRDQHFALRVIGRGLEERAEAGGPVIARALRIVTPTRAPDPEGIQDFVGPDLVIAAGSAEPAATHSAQV